MSTKLRPVSFFLDVGPVGLLRELIKSLFPDDCGVIDGPEDVKEIVEHLVEELLWPASLVPAEARVVIEEASNITLIDDHVEEHV